MIQRFVIQQPEWSDTGIIGKKIQVSLQFQVHSLEQKKNLFFFDSVLFNNCMVSLLLQRSGESPHLRARLLQDGADGDVPLDQEDFTVQSVLQMLLTERANGEHRL